MHVLFSEAGIGPEQLHVLMASLAGIKGGCLDTLELAGVRQVTVGGPRVTHLPIES